MPAEMGIRTIYEEPEVTSATTPSTRREAFGSWLSSLFIDLEALGGEVEFLYVGKDARRYVYALRAFEPNEYAVNGRCYGVLWDAWVYFDPEEPPLGVRLEGKPAGTGELQGV